MARRVEVWFEVVSPMSHNAYYRLPDLRARAGAKIVFKPMLLGGVMKQTGNRRFNLEFSDGIKRRERCLNAPAGESGCRAVIFLHEMLNRMPNFALGLYLN